MNVEICGKTESGYFVACASGILGSQEPWVVVSKGDEIQYAEDESHAESIMRGMGATVFEREELPYEAIL